LRRNLLKLIQERDVDLDARLKVSSLEASELTAAQEKSRQFHEKWVVGYGHASVAEHAAVHLAIENVSSIATKIIEDTRLASYTEISTHYVPVDGEKFCRVPGLMQSPHATLYENTVRFLQNTYVALVHQVVVGYRVGLGRLPRNPTASNGDADVAVIVKALWIQRSG
jgi:thymidylate synthase ThyX